MNKGYFTLFTGEDGQFYFNLKAANNEIILRSEGYESKDGALNGIDSVQRHCTSTENYVEKLSKNNKPFFVLRAGNNKIIGVGQLYSSEQAMRKGIESVKKNGKSKVIKGTDKTFFEIVLNDVSFDVKPGFYLGSEILQIGGYVGPRFCLFLLTGDKREEVGQNEKIEIKGCLRFRIVMND